MTRHTDLTCNPRRLPPVRSKLWREMVDYRLRNGWGVEDIALQLHCHVERVRDHVDGLRANGVLSGLVRSG